MSALNPVPTRSALRGEIENALQRHAPGAVTAPFLARSLELPLSAVERELGMMHREGCLVRRLHRALGEVYLAPSGAQ